MISSNYTPDYFNEGDEVLYVPKYALEEFADWLRRDAPDWVFKYAKFQRGIVKSKNDKFVFVNYFIKDTFQETANATNPQDLILWKKRDI